MLIVLKKFVDSGVITKHTDLMLNVPNGRKVGNRKRKRAQQWTFSLFTSVTLLQLKCMKCRCRDTESYLFWWAHRYMQYVELHGYSVWRTNHRTHKHSYARLVLFSPNRLMVKPSKWIKDPPKKDLKNLKFDGFAEPEPLNLPTPLKQCNKSWYQMKQAWQFGNGPF